jgi:predicted nucleotidyltransferase
MYPDDIVRVSDLILLRYEKYRVLGLIMFGSRVQRPEAHHNDLDCLIVVEADIEKSDTVEYQDLQCDLLICGVQRIKRHVERPGHSNNNFFLDLLANGALLKALSEELLDIVNDAKIQYALGPARMTGNTKKQAIQGLRAIIKTAKIEKVWADCCSDSPDTFVVSDMMLDVAVREALRIYLHANGKWASSLAQNLFLIRKESLSIMPYWDAYSERKRGRLLSWGAGWDLVQYVISVLGQSNK